MLIRWRDNSSFPAVASMFDDILQNDLTSFFGRDMSDFFNRNSNMVMPAVNIKETQDSFQIELAAPGLSKEDFKLDLNRNILTVSAQKETRSGYEPAAQSQVDGQSSASNENKAAGAMDGQSATANQTENQSSDVTQAAGSASAGQNQTNGKPARYTRREFSYTSFQRSFTLPETTEPERITAAYQDGILTIQVPKREQKPVPASRTISIS